MILLHFHTGTAVGMNYNRCNKVTRVYQMLAISVKKIKLLNLHIHAYQNDINIIELIVIIDDNNLMYNI